MSLLDWLHTLPAYNNATVGTPKPVPPKPLVFRLREEREAKADAPKADA